MPDGQLLACGRTEDDQHLDLFRSLDSGKTWTYEQAVSFGMQIPANLLDLGDGRILLSYGDRRKEHGGIEARVSNDEGRSWCEKGNKLEDRYGWKDTCFCLPPRASRR